MPGSRQIWLDSRFRVTRSSEFRWSPPIARPPALEPEHLDDAPPGQAFTLGLWHLGMGFEYGDERPRFAQNNHWLLPKRWRMAEAFVPTFANRAFGQSLAPPGRASRGGDLVVYPGRDRVLETVSVPTLRNALDRAFCFDFAARIVSLKDPPWPAKRANWIRSSNEDQHLLGVLGMTGGLSRATRLLLHPFLQDVFASLGGTTNLADADIQVTANALAKRYKGKPNFDLKSENERKALAALIVKAAQSIKAPRLHVALSDLQERWRTYRERFWSEHPDQGALSGAELVEWEEREQRAIDDALGVMRKRQLVFQGYPWTCTECQHKNWTDFHSLKSSLACVICHAESELPVDVPWYFKPNEFLIESLRSHSVLSLVWVLSALRERARTSFMYAGPTCFGFSDTYDVADAEADLLAVVDGKAILCEVKSSWRSFRPVDVDSLVSLAKRLRPDQVMLAVMEDGGSRFEEKIKAASGLLAAEGMTLEVLTPERFRD